jgi:hypothetical protein
MCLKLCAQFGKGLIGVKVGGRQLKPQAGELIRQVRETGSQVEVT